MDEKSNYGKHPISSITPKEVLEDWSNRQPKLMRNDFRKSFVEERKIIYTDCCNSLANEVYKLLHHSEPWLRANKKHLTLVMPMWAIDILKNRYHLSNLSNFLGYDLVTGYENKIILFHPNVSIFGKESNLYHEVDISHLLKALNIRKYEPHIS